MTSDGEVDVEATSPATLGRVRAVLAGRGVPDDTQSERHESRFRG